jgi:cyclin H
MIEDDVYRSSSQYRYWSYTKESLARIRQNTNDLASEKVKAAFRRVRAAKSAQNGSSNGSAHDGDIDTLTVDEELKTVEWGCSKIMDMGEAMNPRVPSHVVVRLGCSSSNIDTTISLLTVMSTIDTAYQIL